MRLGAPPVASRVIVTGATGFIGRHLVRRLLAAQPAATITCIAALPASRAEADALAEQRAVGMRTIAADLAAGAFGTQRPPQADIVFHLAANSDTSGNAHMLRVNDLGTRHLLNWLAAAPPARIVHASSIAVHDRGSRPVAPLSEASPISPRTEYGRSKWRGEIAVRDQAPAMGSAWTILRFATVYGRGQKRDGLVQTLADLAQSGHWLARLDWPGRTSLIHVDDAVRLLLSLAASSAAANETYCVAADESPTVGTLARTIARVVGRPLTQLQMPRSVWAAARGAAWSRTAWNLTPPVARQPLWRASLMLDDGFLFDTTKLRAIYRSPMQGLELGLRDTFIRL